jgi:GT2 family glycosyltransferase
MIEAAVLIVTFNGREFLEECLTSVFNSADPDLQTGVIVIDNNSTDGSAQFVREKFPEVEVLALTENRGFAAANNAGWRFAQQKFPNLQYLAILNHDTIVKPGWLFALTSHLQGKPQCAAAQPKILLWPNKDRINTAGNQSNYLGFGVVTGYEQIDDGKWDQPREIDFPSGAALVARVSAIQTPGLFDDEFFLYLEDADLGWKLRQMGYTVDYIPAAVVWHKYTFQRNYEFYYYLERNRWLLLLTYYKLRTLLLISPMLFLMELGQFYFAVRNRVVAQKIRAWRYFFCPDNFSRVMNRRQEAKVRRKISDRQFMKEFAGKVEFSEIKSKTLRRIGNPLLDFYWRLVRPLIFW